MLIPALPPGSPTRRAQNELACRKYGIASFASSLGRSSHALALLLHLSEVFQVWRRLILAGRHEFAVRAQEIVFIFDLDPRIVFRADGCAPKRAGLRAAFRRLGDRPRSRQCVVVHGDLIMEDVLVSLVEKNPLLDDGLAVLMKRQGARRVDAITPQVAGLDFEHIVFAVAVLVDPFADGIAYVSRHKLVLVRPIAPVGVDATI